MTKRIDSDRLAAVLQLLTTECSFGFAEGLRLLVNGDRVQERAAVQQSRPEKPKAYAAILCKISEERFDGKTRQGKAG